MKKQTQLIPSFITIINDSKDDNAKARQETRWASLFPNTHISFIGVDSSLGSNTTLQAAGNLIDILDAGEGKCGIVAVNVAPRGEKDEDGDNGSPFAYFWHFNTLVVSTIKGYNLSLVKKFGLAEQVRLLDTKKVLDFAEQNNLITKQLNNHIYNTQFRSFDFQPRVSRWLWDGLEVPSSKLDSSRIPEAPDTIWHIDSFGNYKTTLLKQDLFRSHPELDSGSTNKKIPKQVRNDKGINTNLGGLAYYDRLKDIPSGKTAIYEGSSGIENERFLEIAKQNTPGSAHKEFAKEIGFEIKVV